MLLAPVLVCLFTAIFSGLQIYLAQQVWPDYNTFLNPETAFLDVSEKVGGKFLFDAVAAILFIACLGSGLAGQIGAARLLFAMGRDGVLPEKIFGHLDIKSNTPVYNIIILGILTVVGSMIISYQGAAEVLNFGAFLAFMGVNIACFRQFYILRPGGKKPGIVMDILLPVLGFLFCFSIWISLPVPAKIIGGLWFCAGLIYLILTTKGFRKRPVMIDLKDIQ